MFKNCYIVTARDDYLIFKNIRQYLQNEFQNSLNNFTDIFRIPIVILIISIYSHILLLNKPLNIRILLINHLMYFLYYMTVKQHLLTKIIYCKILLFKVSYNTSLLCKYISPILCTYNISCGFLLRIRLNV